MATRVDTAFTSVRYGLERQALGALDQFFAQMSADILRAYDAGQTTKIYDNLVAPRPGRERWGDLLADEVAGLTSRAAYDVGSRVAQDLGLNVPGQWSASGMQNYLSDASQQMAYGFSELMEKGLSQASSREYVESFLAEVQGPMRERLAREIVGTGGNFGAYDAAQRAGASFKQWKVTSGNPRPEHSAMNGEVRPLGDPFSNGMAYPRGSGPPGQTANCKCVMVIVRAGDGDAG